jgi:hypothetical protein
MKPIKCDNCKKFYDADKYESCPHCKDSGSGSSFSVKKDTAFTEEKKDKLVSEHHERKSRKFFSKLGAIKTETSGPNPESLAEDNQTEALNKEFDYSKNIKKEAFVLETQESDKKTEGKDNCFESEPETIHTQADEPVLESVPVTIPISEAVKKADAVQNPTDQKTVAFYNFSNDIEPVVGWLVCIKGEYHGASFNLKSGRNNIGRALTMDVALAQEKSVSRERHASVTFDPHQQKFFVQSGDGNGLTYVNNELLMMFRELQPYDIISLGACELMFLPLCGEKFSWEDHI